MTALRASNRRGRTMVRARKSDSQIDTSSTAMENSVIVSRSSRMMPRISAARVVSSSAPSAVWRAALST